MRLGIFAKTFAGDRPDPVFAAARAAGYHAVQYNMACSGLSSLPEAIEPQTAEDARAAAARHGVEIAAVSATYNMIHPDLATRLAGRRSFAAIAGAARAMGVNLVTLCTGSCDAKDQWRWHADNASAQSWRALSQEFEAILPIAERHDVLLEVEPELANVIADAKSARRLIDQFGSSRIRIVLDPANLFEVETDARRRAVVEAAVALLANSLALAHAKDRFPDGAFAPAGQGVVDFTHFIAALRGAGFDGALVTHGLSEAQAPMVARFLERALAS